jgi:hypothetical protein
LSLVSTRETGAAKNTDFHWDIVAIARDIIQRKRL